MSTNYTPATYADGSVRTGAEQSNQETRIDNAVGALEGVAYVPGEDIHTNAADILAVKGASGPPVSTIVTLNDLLTNTATIDPGHKHTSGSWSGPVPSHTHAAADILGEPGTVFAGQTDFDAAVGVGWTAIIGTGGVNLMAHDTSITTNAADIVTLQGVGWVAETVKDNNALIISGNDPGHTHTASVALTDYSTLALQTDLDTLTGVDQGQAWNVGDPQQRIWWIWNEMVNGTGPGHTHPWADITGAPTFTLKSDFDALAGSGWNPTLGASGYNVVDLYTNQVNMQGPGWTTETIKQNADDIVSLRGVGYTSETVKQNATDIATNASDILDAQGPTYSNTVDQPTNVTGVTLSYPSTNGTSPSTYGLTFTFVSPGSHTLQWAGGTPVVLATDMTTYQLPDSVTGHIDAFVTFAGLPGSTQTDAAIVVRPQNIGNIYDQLLATGSGANTLLSHVLQVHRNGLTSIGTVTANGIDRQLTLSNIQGDIAGVLVPAGTTKASGSLTLAGGLAATEARIDLITLDQASTLSVTAGTIFSLASGKFTFPSIPSNELFVRYVYVPGDRAYLVQSDVMEDPGQFDPNAMWDRAASAKDQLGTGQDSPYGLSIEIPRLITGTTLIIHDLFHIQQPTDTNASLTGVTTQRRADSTTHSTFYDTTPPGQYVLAYDNAATTLTWDSGAPVDVSAGGTFTLFDSTAITAIEVVVVAGSLPASNQSATIDIGVLPTPGVGRYAISYDNATGNFTFDSGTPVVINGAPGLYLAQGQNGHWVGVYVEVVLGLPNVVTNDDVRVYDNNLTDLDIKIEELGRALHLGGTGAGATGTPSTTFTIGDATTTGTFQQRFGASPLDAYWQMDHRTQQLSATSSFGQDLVFISDTTSFAIGRTVVISGTTPERRRIIAINPNASLQMDHNLDANHTTSDFVTQQELYGTNDIVIPNSASHIVRRSATDANGANEDFDLLRDNTIFWHGQMFGDYDPTSGVAIGTVANGATVTPAPWSLYREWTSAEASLQSHNFMFQFVMPGDMANIDSKSDPVFTLKFTTTTNLTTDNQVTFKMYTPTVSPSVGPVASTTGGTIDTSSFLQNAFAFEGWKAGDEFTVVAECKAKSGNYVRINGFQLQYARKPAIDA